MSRSQVASTVVAIAVLALVVPATAAACEGHAEKAKPQSAKVEKSKASATTANTASTETSKVAPAQKPETKPATTDAAKDVQSALLGEIDVLVADKCSCSNAADCTCKKGQCKCKACKHKRMIEPVKGTTDALQLPKEARYEATSGVFI